MQSCCENKAAEIAQLRASQSSVLKVVLAINVVMFGVELVAGTFARSTSLLADSLDMLGDSLVYAFSLFVLDRGSRWRAGAALLKGVIMIAFGVGVFLEALGKAFADIVPRAEVISSVGLLALAANGVCLMLLMRRRHDDINMRSTWLCSRNDIIANVGVIAAGALVMMFTSKWPDIGVGMVIAGIFLWTSVGVLKDATKELRAQPAAGA